MREEPEPKPSWVVSPAQAVAALIWALSTWLAQVCKSAVKKCLDLGATLKLSWDSFLQSNLKMMASKLKATWKKARDLGGDKVHWSVAIFLWILLGAYLIFCFALGQSNAIFNDSLAWILIDCFADDPDHWKDLLKVCR